MISKRTVRFAKASVGDAHKAFHAAVGDVGKKAAHKPGYYDGIGAVVLARLDEVEAGILALARRLIRRRPKKQPTAWNLHVASVLKAGGSIRQAAELWKVKKA